MTPQELERRIERVLAGDGLTVVCQPILDLATRTVVGYEALARFSAEPYLPPDRWFADAAAIGRGTELELAAIERALDLLPTIPGQAYLSLNASPSTISSPLLADRFQALGNLDRLVLEVTEHAPIDDYACLADALDPQRRRGLRLAVDDAGAGFASLRHILRLKPDYIKLDRTITELIDRDHSTRAIAGALTHFALETQATITAEGIETDAQLDTMRALGVTVGQGYLLGRPGPLVPGEALGAGAGPRATILSAAPDARPRVLCVDDEPFVLEGMRDILRRGFAVQLADSGEEGLELLKRDPAGFAVVISDMRMPGMNGAVFLREARRVAPLAVRMLLTGETDAVAAASAVNEGQIFRFLHKPCPSDDLRRACAAAASHHALIAAERALLETP
jgi:EAL domain-containing protein (putative c-di-GMP-specific phosphodiesterase class I)/CheY-like chemotaxis protein